jgi:hypothetical protein
MPNTALTIFSQKKKQALLRYISSGRPASKFLAKHKLSSTQLYNAISLSHSSYDPSFRKEYLRAREQMAHSLADDILTISDDSEEEVQRSRLRVDSRKWLASKLHSQYGDKIQVETTNKVSILDHLNDVINVTPERLESEQ